MDSFNILFCAVVLSTFFLLLASVLKMSASLKLQQQKRNKTRENLNGAEVAEARCDRVVILASYQPHTVFIIIIIISWPRLCSMCT